MSVFILSVSSQGSILRRIDLAKFATSSKIEALTQELVQMRKESPGSKAIVFSQFVNMLDLIRYVNFHSRFCFIVLVNMEKADFSRKYRWNGS